MLSLRDVFVAAVVFGSLPVVLFQPYVGVLVWTWLSFMNPHQLAWGFARSFPFAKIVAGATILGCLSPAAPKRLPVTVESFILFVFCVWMSVTTLFALEPQAAWGQWEKIMKIELIVFVTMALVTSRKHLDVFIWTLVLSIGFYGVKGGIFTIVYGGQFHVFGPPNSFFEGNNGLGLVLPMTIPLMRYLQKVSAKRWVRWGLSAAIVLTAIATLGTQSRGAFLGIVATFGFLVIRGRGKAYLLSASVLMIPIALLVMPTQWFDRMETIQSYEEDSSAMGRINAWRMATNLAMDRPLVGGGFGAFSPESFVQYAPDPDDFHDSHSIYFEVLGEHGFVGLFLFLLLFAVSWRSCSTLKKKAKRHDETSWMVELASMLQASLFAYAVAGAFLGLAFFDLYYTVIAMIVITKLLFADFVTAEVEEEAPVRNVAPTRRLATRMARASS